MRRLLDRYELHGEIAAGGMATVHLGRLVGPVGFTRRVAIKRLHPQFAKDPEFVAMFMDEAKLAARIQHPNVVQTLDVVLDDGELFLILDFVDGVPLSQLLKSSDGGLPPRLAVGVVSGICAGLHAAHEACGSKGEALGIVHRDVSPQNVLVGRDGVARVLDFGVAKAVSRAHTTREGQIKGKLAYMSPEQVRAGSVDRRADVYAAGVVLWEALAGRRLFTADDQAGVVLKVVEGTLEPPSRYNVRVPEELDALVMRALARTPDERFDTAQDMAAALEHEVPPATLREIAAWVVARAGTLLDDNARALDALDGGSQVTAPAASKQEASVVTEGPVASPLAGEPGGSRVRLAMMVGAITLFAGLAAGVFLAPSLVSAPVRSPPLPSPMPEPTDLPVGLSVPLPPILRAPPASASVQTPRPSSSVLGCVPPYNIGRDGVKRFKSWCLR